jgi:hypothetical protein
VAGELPWRGNARLICARPSDPSWLPIGNRNYRLTSSSLNTRRFRRRYSPPPDSGRDFLRQPERGDEARSAPQALRRGQAQQGAACPRETVAIE